MKKLLILAAFSMIGAVASFGQNNFTYSGATHDTLTDANTVYAYLGSSVGKMNGTIDDLGILFTPKKVTGSTVGGYAILQSSQDGTNWSNHFGNVGTTGYTYDTATIANSASIQTLKWHVGGLTQTYYRLKIVGGSGLTQTMKLTGKYSVRNK